MSRYTGPSWKLSRRLGISLSGTGKKSLVVHTHQVNTDQTAVKKLSEYGQQLQEKTKTTSYVWANERQFATLFKKSWQN